MSRKFQKMSEDSFLILFIAVIVGHVIAYLTKIGCVIAISNPNDRNLI